MSALHQSMNVSESHEGWLKYAPYNHTVTPVLIYQPRLALVPAKLQIIFFIANEKRSFYEYYTVNSEIFARVLSSRNFAHAKFREN